VYRISLSNEEIRKIKDLFGEIGKEDDEKIDYINFMKMSLYLDLHKESFKYIHDSGNKINEKRTMSHSRNQSIHRDFLKQEIINNPKRQQTFEEPKETMKIETNNTYENVSTLNDIRHEEPTLFSNEPTLLCRRLKKITSTTNPKDYSPIKSKYLDKMETNNLFATHDNPQHPSSLSQVPSNAFYLRRPSTYL